MKNNKKTSVKSICITAIFSALVFVFTYLFKIPTAFGYIHLGDVVIFMSLIFLDAKSSVFSAAVGSTLADLLSGYTVFALPTFFIKLAMVLICGLFYEKISKHRVWGFVLGATFGSIVQIAGYTLTSVFLFDKSAALVTIPENLIQSTVAVVGSLVLMITFNKNRFKSSLL